jgi:hypothetical protein
MFALLSQQKRDLYLDNLTLDAIRDYSASSLKQAASDEIKSAVVDDLLRRFNSRQVTYAKCKSLMGSDFPGAGSKVFAFSFFVFRALDQTRREQFDEILAGKAPIAQSDLKDFPSLETIIKNAVFVGSTVKEIDFDRHIRKLR